MHSLQCHHPFIIIQLFEHALLSIWFYMEYLSAFLFFLPGLISSCLSSRSQYRYVFFHYFRRKSKNIKIRFVFREGEKIFHPSLKAPFLNGRGPCLILITPQHIVITLVSMHFRVNNPSKSCFLSSSPCLFIALNRRAIG